MEGRGKNRTKGDKNGMGSEGRLKKREEEIWKKRGRKTIKRKNENDKRSNEKEREGRKGRGDLE